MIDRHLAALPRTPSIHPLVKQVLRKLLHRQGWMACPFLGYGLERLRGKAWAAVVCGAAPGRLWLLLGTRWLLWLPDGCAWLLRSSEGHDMGGQRVDLGLQRLQAGGQAGELRLEVVAGVWLRWLPCEVLPEGVADDGC